MYTSDTGLEMGRSLVDNVKDKHCGGLLHLCNNFCKLQDQGTSVSPFLTAVSVEPHEHCNFIAS
jgi:hypothetical protein